MSDFSSIPFTDSTLEDVAAINPESLLENTPPSYSFRYIDLSAVKEGNIDWSATQKLSFASAPSRARRKLQQGDCIFGTVRPLKQSHGFIDHPGEDLVASTGFAVVRARCGAAVPRFLYHWMLSTSTLRQSDNLSVGSNYPAVNESDVRRFRLPLPPYHEQQRIAEVLDALEEQISAADSERFSSCDLTGLKDVDGFGELPGTPGAAAEFAQDAPGLELGVGALAG